MAVITLRDKKTNEPLYPDTLINNTFDESGNTLTSVLSKKADLVDGVVPLSQLPSSLTGADSAKNIIVNGVPGILDPSGVTSVTVTGRDIDISSNYKKTDTYVSKIPESASIDNAIGILEGNTEILREILGEELDVFTPAQDSNFIKETKTIKEAVETLDKSVSAYVNELFKWSENG